MSTFTMKEVESLVTANGGGNKNNRRLWYGKLSDSQFQQKLPSADASMSKIKNWINVVYERKGYYLKGGRRLKAKTKSPAKAAPRKTRKPSSKAKAKASAARKAPAPAEDLLDFGTDSWADPFGDDSPSSSAPASTPPDFFGGGDDSAGAGAPSSDLMGDNDLLGGDVTATSSSSSGGGGGFGAAELSNLFGSSSMPMAPQPQTSSSLNSNSSMFSLQAQVQQPKVSKGALISSLGMRRMPQRQTMPRRGPHLLQGMGARGQQAQSQGFAQQQQQPRMMPRQQQPRMPQQRMMRPSGTSEQQRQGGMGGMGAFSMRALPPQPMPQKKGPTSAVASQPIRVGSGMRGPGPMRPMMNGAGRPMTNKTGLDALDPFASLSLGF